MRTFTVNVQIQFDQYYPESARQYTLEVVEKINAILMENMPDIQPQILVSGIDSTDIQYEDSKEDE